VGAHAGIIHPSACISRRSPRHNGERERVRKRTKERCMHMREPEKEAQDILFAADIWAYKPTLFSSNLSTLTHTPLLFSTNTCTHTHEQRNSFKSSALLLSTRPFWLRICTLAAALFISLGFPQKGRWSPPEPEFQLCIWLRRRPHLGLTSEAGCEYNKKPSRGKFF
jgi:hypothetical protein